MSAPLDTSPDPATPGPRSGEPAGVRDSVREMGRAALEYLRLRWALFGLEATAVAGYLARVGVAVAVVIVGGGLAYLTGWGVVVVWTARRWAGGDLLPPLAVMAGFHAIAAGMAVWWLAARARRHAIFPATRAEFAEDQKWLHHPKP